MVFCIDVRSEPFRRALEQCGNYETLGFAGFFGLAIQIKNNEQLKDLCPVLLKPSFQVEEKFLANSDLVNNINTVNEANKAFLQLYPQLKYNFSTAFSLVEALGPWYGLRMLLQSTFPNISRKVSTFIKKLASIKLEQVKSVFTITEIENNSPMTLHQQINHAETILNLMGLTSNFAKVVVFCGHGSTTLNNPYASSLDCGACGGNQGDINARLLATILNKVEVRQSLEDKGIHIPLDTQFFGALHNTTTDAVEVFDKAQRVIYPTILSELKENLKRAQSANNKERSLNLTVIQSPKNIFRRSNDWSEVRPEWGLARNAAFIVAPRCLTKDLNLAGRCFLHSYKWENDPDGVYLEMILTAPMIVAQWINAQYLFSTIDNISYGSGSKITHNVTGKIGVMQGNASDLMHGLPVQSVMINDQKYYHIPQRLLTVVLAPRDIVSSIIKKHKILENLFFNEWVHLIVIDPTDNQFYRLEKPGHWIGVTKRTLYNFRQD
ncbi:hypothetical protein Ljam_1653 [Legionella jamestowniensis]|uniref:Uncharacterized protein n=2 Tax=Legionella jamestowniensis TaxID=455 RepID=A0A0W0UHU2_9GAMM|nr:hypothetical protein Ljam_1653 [Legionella jamestowniensis]